MTTLIQNLWNTSVGKKQLVGITGLAVSGFSLVHMTGNLLLFAGPETYNRYSHTLTSTPLIYVAEAGLLLFFIVHIYLAISLNIDNRRAHPNAYAQRPHAGPKKANFASRTMVYSGLLLFVFLVLHLITFKYGTFYSANYGGVEMRDLYQLVVEKFHQPGYVAWYLFALLVLGLHLSHGIGATFQSLGFFSVRLPWLRTVSIVAALVIAGGFITQPLYFYFTR